MFDLNIKKTREILRKQQVLKEANATLKKEFVGIDMVIDDVTDAMSSWFLFPDFQEKPVVINLWGLTGVGKSSLVERLSTLLGFQEKYYHFDLGEQSNNKLILKGKIEQFTSFNNSDTPLLLAFDEFQYARTIDEQGDEMDNSALRTVWQLLDSGKFQVSRYNHNQDDIYDLILNLKHVLEAGIKVTKGKVTFGQKFYRLLMNARVSNRMYPYEPMKEEEGDPYFIPERYHDVIFDLAKDKFKNSIEVGSQIRKFNGHESIDFLFQILNYSSSAKTVDCSKSLIFVLGNLDDAYTMNNDFNPDMDADEFHLQSKKITIPIVKKALQVRFKSEQIARLGNIHIIYPAFNKLSFQKIIALELEKIAANVHKQQEVFLRFDKSIHDLIYREGVYPTQGTRPLFSTIHQIINTKLGKVVTEMILKKLPVTSITFLYKHDFILVEYRFEKEIVHTLCIDQQLNLDKLRKSRKDELQAISAVHEAGHAILFAVLMNIAPELILSNTLEYNSAGLTITKINWKYISQKEISNRLAIYLGGYIAEKIVFGEDNVTAGAENDIEKATNLITHMLKECGMGSLLAAYDAEGITTKYFIYDESNRLSKEAESWLRKAMELAEKTLKEQEVLLIKMADYLSDHRSMTKTQIRRMIKKYARNFDTKRLDFKGPDLFYRKHLKSKSDNIEKKNRTLPVIESNKISLNHQFQINEK